MLRIQSPIKIARIEPETESTAKQVIFPDKQYLAELVAEKSASFFFGDIVHESILESLGKEEVAIEQAELQLHCFWTIDSEAPAHCLGIKVYLILRYL